MIARQENEALPVASPTIGQSGKNEVLISITEQNGRRAVNARELHQKLGSRRDFSSWIKERIDKFGFVENQDFEVFTKFGENSQGGRSRIEYALSIDMAKELCMVENNEQGRAIRKYFIAIEQKARASVASYQIEDPIKRAERWIEEQKQRKQLEAENEEQRKRIEESQKVVVELNEAITQMQPKASYYDRILANKSTLKVSQVALDYGMTARAFNAMLARLRIQRKVGNQWVLYAPYLDKGYVHSHSFEIKHNDNTSSFTNTTEWTQKGRLFLYDTLKRQGIVPMIERDN